MDQKFFSEQTNQVLVWDAPTRIFHWALVVCFAGAMLTQDTERLHLWHVTFGYTLLGLVGFRIVWGFIGTRYARFGSFVPSRESVGAYLGDLLRGRPQHGLGHSPIGALAIFAMLLLAIVVSASGIPLEQGILEDFFEELHEGSANLLFAITGVHVAGVLFSSFVLRENLVRAMFTGRKQGTSQGAIRYEFWWLGVCMMVAILAFWLHQFDVIR